MWLPDAAFDLNSDSSVTLEDHRVWVKDLKHTWFGDADLNGEFNSNDFVQVFQAGKYENGQVRRLVRRRLERRRHSSTATTSSSPSRMAATSRDRGRMWRRCRSRGHRCCS